MAWSWRSALTVGAAVMVGFAHLAAGEEAGFVDVRVAPGDSLRAIAERHLGDPDLWPTILELNGLERVTEVEPGMVLKLPAGQLAAADQAIAAALDAIQEATEAGARLFAPADIEDAIALHDRAVSHRSAADYPAAAETAGQARIAAVEALAAATAARDQAAEALLNDRHGWVEGQRPEDLIWSERIRNAILIEQEKVRTLSSSTAQITFRDDSRLRLNANSHAVIQRMRVDPLSREEEAEISLIEGDFYALLGGRSAKKSFEVEVANVESEIDSGSFWVSNDAEGAKFTNYDDRVLTVSAEGESVTLGRNEGTVIRPGRPPAAKAGLLAPPVLLAPADRGEVGRAEVTFAWEPLDAAAGYWLEIAFDPDYREMAISRFGLARPGYVTSELLPETYYWRVAALDGFGLPGNRSPSRELRLKPDATPPFLTIERPAEGAILRDASLRLEGRSEPGVRLNLDGTPVAVAADGSFSLVHEARAGINQVTVEAIDAAGNVTRRERGFVVMPDVEATVAFALDLPRRGEGHFLTATDEITLSGTTRPGARLAIGQESGPRVTTFADESGAFTLNLPVDGVDQAFGLTVTAPSGFATEGGILVSVDQEAPVITLDAPPPAVTSLSSISLAGEVDEAATVTLNGLPLAQVGGRFTAILPLSGELGRFELAATDLVGNVRLERFEVRLDQTPPALLDYRLAPDPLAAGSGHLIEVEASDPSGMLQAAAFTLEVDGRAESGFLNLDPASGRYLARVVLARPAGAPLRLRDVVLEDYAGNRRRYMIE